MKASSSLHHICHRSVRHKHTPQLHRCQAAATSKLFYLEASRWACPRLEVELPYQKNQCMLFVVLLYGSSLIALHVRAQDLLHARLGETSGTSLPRAELHLKSACDATCFCNAGPYSEPHELGTITAKPCAKEVASMACASAFSEAGGQCSGSGAITAVRKYSSDGMLCVGAVIAASATCLRVHGNLREPLSCMRRGQLADTHLDCDKRRKL